MRERVLFHRSVFTAPFFKLMAVARGVSVSTPGCLVPDWPLRQTVLADLQQQPHLCLSLRLWTRQGLGSRVGSGA